MSEGPEVKRTADKIAEAILGKSIVDLQGKTIENRLKEKIVGSKVLSVDTYGKNIIIYFSGGIFLRNHMMMWGKWRIYKRTEYDRGKQSLHHVSFGNENYGKAKAIQAALKIP